MQYMGLLQLKSIDTIWFERMIWHIQLDKIARNFRIKTPSYNIDYS